MTDLDSAIRAKLAVDKDSYYFEYDCEMIQGAVFAVLDLHPATYCPGESERHVWHNVPAYDSAGKHIGYIPTKGEKLPPDWCERCSEAWPCPTVQAIAKGLGIEA